MKNIFRQHTLLLILGMSIFSGCAKNSLTANDNPLGGQVPAARAESPKATAAPGTAAQGANSTSMSGSNQTQKTPQDTDSVAAAAL